jgi:hypothetical protein
MATKNGISVMVLPQDRVKLIKKLRQVDSDFAAALPNMITQTAFAIQDDAKREARVQYGVLRASIYVDTKRQARMVKSGIEGKGKQIPIPLRFPESRPDGLDAYVGSEMNYALKIEMDVKPYLFPAYEKHSKRFMQAVEKKLSEVIKK